MKHYVVRFTGEFGTKDRRTRWRLIDLLKRNIEKAIGSYCGKDVLETASVTTDFDKVEIECSEDLSEILPTVAGVRYFNEVHKHEYFSLKDIADYGQQYFAEVIKGKEFAVRCKRRGKLAFVSRDVEIAIGDKIHENGKVNLSNPEVTCFVEVDDTHVYFSLERMDGPAGFPLGSQGKALCLISGGFDSPIAAWEIWRNGIDQDFVYFDLGGDAQRDCIINSVQYIKKNYGHGSKGKLTIINFLPVMEEILKGPMPFQNMMLKYCFYQVAERLAEHYSAEALVTGESLGQVSTQTLKNLAALDQTTPLLILRPVASWDKEDIIDKARQMGTADLAYKGKELCAIAGKGVVTGTTIKKLNKALSEVDLIPIIELVVEQKEVFKVEEWEAPKERLTSAPENYKIIDVRSEGDFKINHMDDAENIPFNRAINEFYNWDKNDNYFIVCNVGSQSAILSNFMQQEGFTVEHMSGGMEQVN